MNRNPQALCVGYYDETQTGKMCEHYTYTKTDYTCKFFSCQDCDVLPVEMARPKNDKMAMSLSLRDKLAKAEAAMSSHWDDHPDHRVEDWRYEVSNNDTRQSYKEWVLSQVEQQHNEENE